MFVGDESEKLRKDGTGFALVRVQITYKEGGYGCTLLKTRVQEVPKTKSSKLRETDRIGDVRGIVRRAGECRDARQSGGTQYNKPCCESLTQPLGSGSARKLTHGEFWGEDSGMEEGATKRTG